MHEGREAVDGSIGLLFRQSSRGVDVNHQPVLGFYLIPLFDTSTDAESFNGWTHLLENVTDHYGLLLIFAGNSMDRTYPKKGKRIGLTNTKSKC